MWYLHTKKYLFLKEKGILTCLNTTEPERHAKKNKPHTKWQVT